MRISDCSSSGCGSACQPPPPCPPSQQDAGSPRRTQGGGGVRGYGGANSLSATSQGRETTKAELLLTTADGDKVTLSFSSGSSYQYSGDYGPRRRSVSAAGGSTASFEIKVEGNLSQQELADIQKLAKIMVGAANQASQGDVEKASASVEQAKQLDTIQNFAFSLNRSVTQAYSYEATLDQLR